jgi:hypothetical protein
MGHTRDHRHRTKISLHLPCRVVALSAKRRPPPRRIIQPLLSRSAIVRRIARIPLPRQARTSVERGFLFNFWRPPLHFRHVRFAPKKRPSDEAKTTSAKGQTQTCARPVKWQLRTSRCCVARRPKARTLQMTVAYSGNKDDSPNTADTNPQASA